MTDILANTQDKNAPGTLMGKYILRLQKQELCILFLVYSLNLLIISNKWLNNITKNRSL